MKEAWNEYWDEVYRPAMTWMAKHWKGYILFVAFVYLASVAGAMSFIYRHEIADKVKALLKKEENKKD